tara:strand:+ start:1538 stop:3205 length:1668 start_codon:yes stop_codon:yes gene_type:complete
MGFNGKAFAAAFLKQLGQGVETRLAEAKEFEKEEREKAKRNLQIYNQRKAKMKVAKVYAQAIRKSLGAGTADYNAEEANRAIMFYAKDGVGSLQSAFNALNKQMLLAKSNGLEFSPSDASDFLNVAEEFKPEKMKMEDFWNKTFNFIQENEQVEPSTSSEGMMGNVFMSAMGIGAKDRVRRKLAQEQYVGDQTIESLNRLAESQETRDVFGGAYAPATLDISALPSVIGSTKLNQIYTDFERNKTMYMKKANISDYLVERGLDVEDMTIRNDIKNERGDAYEDFEKWAKGKASKDTLNKFYGNRVIDTGIKQQLSFLDFEEEDVEKEAEGTTSTAEVATKAKVLDDTVKQDTTMSLPSNIDLKTDNESVYVYVEAQPSMRRKFGRRIFKMPVNKAHLFDDFIDQVGAEKGNYFVSTNLNDVREHMKKFLGSNLLPEGEFFNVTDLLKDRGVDTSYGGFPASLDGKEYVGVTVSNNKVVPVYQGKETPEGEAQYVTTKTTINEDDLKQYVTILKNIKGTVNEKNDREKLNNFFMETYGFLPTQSQIIDALGKLDDE